MKRGPPGSTRTDSLVPYTTLCRSGLVAMARDAPGGAISHLDLEKRGQQVGGRPAIAIGGVGEALPVAVDARQAQGLQQGRQYGGGLILGAGHQCTSPLAIRLL